MKFDINKNLIECSNLHNNKYDYKLSEYVNSRTKIIIICPIHGKFKQLLKNHRKFGCSKCSGLNRMDNQSFIEKSIKIHGNKYKYDHINYINTRKNIIIECPKHGKFKQKPYSHLNGKGCPECKTSKGENIILNYLKSNNILYDQEKSFNDCKSNKGNLLRFDFYCPDYNICVEYDGEQHYKIVEFFGSKDGFNERIKNDTIKNDYCINNNIKLLRIPYYINKKEDIYNKISSFLKINQVC